MNNVSVTWLFPQRALQPAPSGIKGAGQPKRRNDIILTMTGMVLALHRICFTRRYLSYSGFMTCLSFLVTWSSEMKERKDLLLVSCRRAMVLLRKEGGSQVGLGCSRSGGELSAGPLSQLRFAPASYPVGTDTGSESACSFGGDFLKSKCIAAEVGFTLMSSGRFTSSLFSCSFFKMDSRVFSTGGLGAFSCWGFLSSWEPKLLGRVLLRWRVWGGRSSSDFISLRSGWKRGD